MTNSSCVHAPYRSGLGVQPTSDVGLPNDQRNAEHWDAMRVVIEGYDCVPGWDAHETAGKELS